MNKFFFMVLFFINNLDVHSQIVYTDINPDCERLVQKRSSQLAKTSIQGKSSTIWTLELVHP
jgi:hypothetical protein